MLLIFLKCYASGSSVSSPLLLFFFFELLTLAGTNNGIGRFKIGILQFEAFAYFFLNTTLPEN